MPVELYLHVLPGGFLHGKGGFARPSVSVYKSVRFFVPLLYAVKDRCNRRITFVDSADFFISGNGITFYIKHLQEGTK